MVWSSLAPKWPIPVPFCGMDHQKSNFSLISDTLSVGGCWGQPMSFFWKLVDETQIFLTPEATRHHNSIKSLILLPLRANLLYILHYETPCSYGFVVCRRTYILWFYQQVSSELAVTKSDIQWKHEEIENSNIRTKEKFLSVEMQILYLREQISDLQEGSIVIPTAEQGNSLKGIVNKTVKR